MDRQIRSELGVGVDASRMQTQLVEQWAYSRPTIPEQWRFLGKGVEGRWLVVQQIQALVRVRVKL